MIDQVIWFGIYMFFAYIALNRVIIPKLDRIFNALVIEIRKNEPYGHDVLERRLNSLLRSRFNDMDTQLGGMRNLLNELRQETVENKKVLESSDSAPLSGHIQEHQENVCSPGDPHCKPESIVYFVATEKIKKKMSE